MSVLSASRMTQGISVGHHDRTVAVLCITKNGVVRGKGWTRQTPSDALDATNWDGLCGTPWRNNLLLFEARGAFWGYGRFSPILMHLACIMLIMAGGRHVDDFTGVWGSNRRRKLNALCQRQLDANALSPTDAGGLAGKAIFFKTSCMGRVGRAAITLLYARHDARHFDTTETDSLGAALV